MDASACVVLRHIERLAVWAQEARQAGLSDLDVIAVLHAYLDERRAALHSAPERRAWRRFERGAH